MLVSRNYKCLKKNVFSKDNYLLVPLRDEDKYAILEWRNAQIDILRQKEILTKEQQETYFNTIITPLFEQEKPNQILWSFLENGKLIGYGGLVHIDWEAKHAEISFLLCNQRNSDIAQFKKDWSVYLNLVISIAFSELNFQKAHTYAYDIRPYYFDIMYDQGFLKEGHLKRHIKIGEKLVDVLILSKFNDIVL